MKKLGTIEIEVNVQNDGLYDIYISHDGNSGEHYMNCTEDKVGELTAGFIDCLAEELEIE